MMNLGETTDPEAKRQKMDIGGIPLEHLHYTTSTYALPLPEVIELARPKHVHRHGLVTIHSLNTNGRDAITMRTINKQRDMQTKLIYTCTTTYTLDVYTIWLLRFVLLKCAS